jgi:ABC-type phosphate/phosphonate transport system substrate-binding protein
MRQNSIAEPVHSSIIQPTGFSSHSDKSLIFGNFIIKIMKNESLTAFYLAGASVFHRARWLVPLLFVVGCVRTCVGIGELGSKERPFLVSLDGWHHPEDSGTDFRTIQDCVEKEAGYRVLFEIFADARTVMRELAAKRAHLGLVGATPFAQEGQQLGLVPLFAVGSRQSFQERSVLIVRIGQNGSDQSLKMGLHLGQHYLSPALQMAHGGTVAYLSQSSATGFLVPRHLMLQAGILPNRAIFTESWELIEELVRKGEANVGALSETYVREKWGVDSVSVGMSHNDVTVVSLSPAFPQRVIATERKASRRIIDAVLKGVLGCVAGPARDGVARTFSGTQFQSIGSDDFSFLRNMMAFQESFVRVLPEQSSFE